MLTAADGYQFEGNRYPVGISHSEVDVISKPVTVGKAERRSRRKIHRQESSGVSPRRYQVGSSLIIATPARDCSSPPHSLSVLMGTSSQEHRGPRSHFQFIIVICKATRLYFTATSRFILRSFVSLSLFHKFIHVL